MKRILAFALIALGLMSTVNVYAGSSSIQFSQQITDVKEGDVFDIDIDLADTTGFTSLDCIIRYDPAVIQLVGPGTMADDIVCYVDGNGYSIPFFSDNLIDLMANQVPDASDEEYEYKGNDVKTAAEIGIIKLSSYVTAADENLMLKKITQPGTLCTLSFKAISAGSTDLRLTDTMFATITPNEHWSADNSVLVNVASGSGSSSSDDPVQQNTEYVTTAPPVYVEPNIEPTTELITKTIFNPDGSTAIADARTGKIISGNVPDDTFVDDLTNVDDPTEATTSDSVTFNDIADFPWAENFINSLASEGIIAGYSDGSFRPRDYVKRCDYVIMLSRAIGLDTSAPSTNNFRDVDANAYYANAVSAARKAGIVNGNGDGTFSPTSLITRQDMMLMAKSALEYRGVSLNADMLSLDKFADNEEISSYAKQGVAAMVSAGIVNGTGDNIEPKGNTTRAQAAVIISKIYDKVN